MTHIEASLTTVNTMVVVEEQAVRTYARALDGARHEFAPCPVRAHRAREEVDFDL